MAKKILNVQTGTVTEKSLTDRERAHKEAHRQKAAIRDQDALLREAERKEAISRIDKVTPAEACKIIQRLLSDEPDTSIR